jgi:ABC-type xylose transport system permease subunit
MQIVILLILALLCEAIVETLKMTFQEGKFNWDRVLALIVSIIVAVITGADLLELVGIPATIPYVGVVLTGILISRGANWLHEFIKKTAAFKT